jgi:hypothetical protein
MPEFLSLLPCSFGPGTPSAASLSDAILKKPVRDSKLILRDCGTTVAAVLINLKEEEDT